MISPSHTLGVLGVSLRQGEVLLVRTSYGSRRWQLPGGFVESRERIDSALRREIHEELGVDATIGEVIGTYIRVFDNNLNIAFRITLPDRLPSLPLGGEILEVGRFRPETLPESTSPRSRRIIADAMTGLPSHLVCFLGEEDSGTLL